MPFIIDQLPHKEFQGRKFYYRAGTTDEKSIREVMTRLVYRRPSIGLTIDPGETWLDLGANVGAFSFYCILQGAKVESYEPDLLSFRLLKYNVPEAISRRTAVSMSKDKLVDFWVSKKVENHYRGTLVGGGRMLAKSTPVPNLFVGHLSKFYDGIKMDIEGSEFEMLDSDAIPDCNKLCFEYHLSRDSSMANLSSRLSYLKSRFRVVSYTKELDDIIKLGGDQKCFRGNDRIIYCVK